MLFNSEREGLRRGFVSCVLRLMTKQVSRLPREVTERQLAGLCGAAARLPTAVATGAFDRVSPAPRAAQLAADLGEPHICYTVHPLLSASLCSCSNTARTLVEHLRTLLQVSRQHQFPCKAMLVSCAGAASPAILPACGHLSHEEAPDALLEFLAGFAGRCLASNDAADELQYSGG